MKNYYHCIGTSIFGCLIHMSVFAQPPIEYKNIYLVRHAEKDTGNNPPLTKPGRERSGRLVEEFKSKKIKRIYVSQFLRTQQTADSLRMQLHIDTVHYRADNSGDAFMQTVQKIKGNTQNILVVGHSNTLPVLLMRLGGQQTEIVIGDNKYDDIFKIHFKKKRAVLYRKKFGETHYNKVPFRKM